MTVLSVCLALVLTVVSGCSRAGCNGATLLEFNNYFLGESVTGDATVGYTETLTYKVKSADNYKTTNLEKSSEIKDDVALYSYEGTYTVTLSVINAVSLPAEITTNIDLEGKTVYHLISDLQIASTYMSTAITQKVIKMKLLKTATFFITTTLKAKFISWVLGTLSHRYGPRLNNRTRTYYSAQRQT